MLIGRYHALLDANVLHPAFMRAALLWFADERLFRPAWSEQILAEWRRSIKRRHTDLTDEQLDAMQQLMLDQFPDGQIKGHEQLIEAIDLPDADDRHVLAAAVVGKCQGIITANTKHFPAAAVAPFTMDIVHPDDFIVNIIDLDPDRALAACRRHRKAMSKTKPSPEEYLERFETAGLVQAHARLSDKRELL
jgi:predicted nucleic acid-binding protein